MIISWLSVPILILISCYPYRPAVALVDNMPACVSFAWKFFFCCPCEMKIRSVTSPTWRIKCESEANWKGKTFKVSPSSSAPYCSPTVAKTVCSSSSFQCCCILLLPPPVRHWVELIKPPLQQNSLAAANAKSVPGELATRSSLPSSWSLWLGGDKLHILYWLQTADNATQDEN